MIVLRDESWARLLRVCGALHARAAARGASALELRADARSLIFRATFERADLAPVALDASRAHGSYCAGMGRMVSVSDYPLEAGWLVGLLRAATQKAWVEEITWSWGSCRSTAVLNVRGRDERFDAVHCSWRRVPRATLRYRPW